MRYIALGALLVVAAGAHANLIVNGSFESPVINASFVTVPAGNNTITGWTVTGSSVDIVSQTFAPLYPARDGVQSIDLAGTPGPGLITQSFATAIGATYYVYFSGSSNGPSATLDVYLNGGTLYNLTVPAQGQWTDYSYQFQANSTTSSIGFGSASTGNQGAMVDRVGVIRVVPEPATMVALGLGVVALLKRRRNQK